MDNVASGRIRNKFSVIEDEGVHTPGSSRTKQSFKDECDINHLMERYARTGVLPQNVRNARYGDFMDVGDFRESQLRLKDAEAQFMALPAKVRDRFKNSPEKFLAFVGDKANYKEAKELGLLRDEPPPAAPPVVVADPPA